MNIVPRAPFVFDAGRTKRLGAEIAPTARWKSLRGFHERPTISSDDGFRRDGRRRACARLALTRYRHVSMKPPSNIKTPAQYIASLPADRAKTIAKVRAGAFFDLSLTSALSPNRVSRSCRSQNVVWSVNRPIGSHSPVCLYGTLKCNRRAPHARRSRASRFQLRRQAGSVSELPDPWIRCIHGVWWALVPSRSAGTPTELSGTTHGRQSVNHLL
jgi:hypothetical protein